jgi:hypothetical protein
MIYKWKKGQAPELVHDITEWGLSLEKNGRQVGYNTIDGIVVSTIFLGIDQSFASTKTENQILFETMVFNAPDPWDEYQQRYETEGDARNGHWDIFLKIRDERRERKADGRETRENR